jgi:hypothetical protein
MTLITREAGQADGMNASISMVVAADPGARAGDGPMRYGDKHKIKGLNKLQMAFRRLRLPSVADDLFFLGYGGSVLLAAIERLDPRWQFVWGIDEGPYGKLARISTNDVLFREMVTQHSRTVGNVIISDLRDVDPIYCGNRFLVYAMHPEQNCSIWIVNGRENRNISFAVGHSIINKTCTVDLGSIVSNFGGGGHRVAGTCQVSHEEAEATLKGLIDAMSGGKAGQRGLAA